MVSAQRARGGALLLLLLALVAGNETETEQCFQVVHPPRDYILDVPEEQGALDVLLRINCGGEQVAAGMLRVFSATGNGTAGGAAIWEVEVKGGEEMFEVRWVIHRSEHWHCSGWRQWLWVLQREDGRQEKAMMRVRAAILEQELEDIQIEARRIGRAPFVLQIGAMDGVGHDHMHPFIKSGTWRGLFVEPLKDYFDALQENYRSLGEEGALMFANKCIAESSGRRTMHRLAPSALKGVGAELLGLDGSSSLLADSAGMPPGIARSIKHGGGEVLREQVAAHMVEEEVAAHMVEEEVECVTLSGLLSEFDVQELDAMAIDTEGYDLEIVRQLLKTPIRPRVIFLEIGLLSGRDQDEAHTILQAEGYTTRPCGYGMELLAVKRQLLPPPEPEL